MPKYRKKPVIIEAQPYREGLEDGFAYHPNDIEDAAENVRFGVKPNPVKKPYIETLEGRHWISPGDYIITGIKGERYPCKPDIFEATYELVEEEATP